MTGALPALRWAWLGSVPYARGWELQRDLAARRATGAIADTLLLLEHPAVYTAGRNTEPAHLGGSPQRLRSLGAEFHEVDRGGSVTFHGPGQLVGYPIVRLRDVFAVPGDPQQGDVVRYLRALERALQLCASAVGVDAAPRPPYTGLWRGGRKLAAIGVKLAAGGITQHGVGLNVATDLRWFDHVVPCGISDGGVGSLVGEGARKDLHVSAVAPLLATALAEVLGRQAERVAADELLGGGATGPEPAAAASAAAHRVAAVVSDNP
ncbi:MAG: lipoyl(octanoyl) transferase LipB [Candidatus Dormibacteria bacterium]